MGKFFKIEEYKKYFFLILNDKIEIFDKEKQINDKNIDQIYILFFLNNHKYIVENSLNLEKFESNFKNELNKNYQLYSHYNEFKMTYERYLTYFIEIFRYNQENKVKLLFLNFFNFQYNEISNTSQNIDEFKTNFINKLKQNDILKSYYNNYNNFFEESFKSISYIFTIDLNKRKENKRT